MQVAVSEIRGGYTLAMNRTHRLIIVAALIIIPMAFLVVSMWVQERQARSPEHVKQVLRLYPQNKATGELRQAIASCTEVRLYKIIDDYPNPNQERLEKYVLDELKSYGPVLVLTGQEMREVINSLHTAPKDSSTPWSMATPVPHGGLDPVYPLEFYQGDKWIADIRVSPWYLRWYTPIKYKGDARILRESWLYIERLVESERARQKQNSRPRKEPL